KEHDHDSRNSSQRLKSCEKLFASLLQYNNPPLVFCYSWRISKSLAQRGRVIDCVLSKRGDSASDALAVRVRHDLHAFDLFFILSGVVLANS
ncbi:hypothetical protein ACC675_37070, partial [Rhizobium ruizarguesonis]